MAKNVNQYAHNYICNYIISVIVNAEVGALHTTYIYDAGITLLIHRIQLLNVSIEIWH